MVVVCSVGICDDCVIVGYLCALFECDDNGCSEFCVCWLCVVTVFVFWMCEPFVFVLYVCTNCVYACCVCWLYLLFVCANCVF